MRKLLRITFTFAFALAFMAGTAMAQNTNTSDVDQSGVDNLADVDQTGQLNDATIDQSDPGLSGRTHEGEILQIGDENSSSVRQTGNANSTFGSVETYGDNNSGHVNQAIWGSDLAIGTIDQGASGAPGNNNVASIDQTSAGGAGGLVRLARIDQDGDGNLARTTQNHTSGSNGQYESFITQDGNMNEAFVTQGGFAPGSSTDLSSDVDQIGNGHYAEVDQN